MQNNSCLQHVSVTGRELETMLCQGRASEFIERIGGLASLPEAEVDRVLELACQRLDDESFQIVLASGMAPAEILVCPDTGECEEAVGYFSSVQTLEGLRDYFKRLDRQVKAELETEDVLF